MAWRGVAWRGAGGCGYDKSAALFLSRCSLSWQTGPMSVIRGVRERARVEVTAAIKDEARRQLAA
ncbi:MAG TPA: hypothetical protein VIW71_03750, partial [Streptomyces sp.]